MSDIKLFVKFFNELNKASSANTVAVVISDLLKKKTSVKIFDNTINDPKEFTEYLTYLEKVFAESKQLIDGQILINKSSIICPLSIKSGDYTAIIEVESGEQKTLDLLEAVSPVIAMKLENIILDCKFSKNINFNNAMKNIAKIIETQYELNYIIPIIGEILDTFIENHLIYIFLKNNGTMKLMWPASCLDREICETVTHITNESEVILNQTEKTGYFPLISEDHLIGCIVAKSTEGAITQEEIYYLLQLVKQAATTITRAKVYSEILQYATLDALTGFYNRRQLDQRVKQEISGAQRRKTPLCAIMTDIDFFKKVNDTYGHTAGDLVLQTVAKIMRSQLREYDIAARYGGEEFVILLPYTKENEAVMVAERLREAVKKQTIDIEKVNTKNKTKNISVTISLGICCYEASYKDKDLLMNADKALYKAKETGRDKVVVYKSS